MKSMPLRVKLVIALVAGVVGLWAVAKLDIWYHVGRAQQADAADTPPPERPAGASR